MSKISQNDRDCVRLRILACDNGGPMSVFGQEFDPQHRKPNFSDIEGAVTPVELANAAFEIGLREGQRLLRLHDKAEKYKKDEQNRINSLRKPDRSCPKANPELEQLRRNSRLVAIVQEIMKSKKLKETPACKEAAEISKREGYPISTSTIWRLMKNDRKDSEYTDSTESQ